MMTTIQKFFIALAVIALAAASYSIIKFEKYSEEKKQLFATSELNLMREKISQEKKEEQDSNRSIQQLKNLVSQRVLDHVSRDSYPLLAERLGVAFNRTQAIRESAAYHALRKGGCDFVEWSELDEKSTSDNLAADVQCKNGRQFNISESEISNSTAPKSIEEKAVSEVSAINQCQSLIEAKIPSRYELSILETKYTVTKNTPFATVFISIDATNPAKGSTIFDAFCAFKPNKSPELRLSERR